MPERSPGDDAIRALLDADLRDELDRHQRQYERDLIAADAANVRAHEWLLSRCVGRPFAHRESDLERDYADLVAFHRERFVGRIKAILTGWKDRPTAG